MFVGQGVGADCSEKSCTTSLVWEVCPTFGDLKSLMTIGCSMVEGGEKARSHFRMG